MEDFLMLTESKKTFLIPSTDNKKLIHQVNFDDKPCKVQWQFYGKKYEISTEGSFQFYPFFSEQMVACIFWGDKRFVHPDNLIIYNSDGNIHFKVSVPKFISNEKMNGGYADKTKTGTFINFERVELIEGMKHLLVNIATDAYHERFGACTTIEVRALNIMKGLFHPTWNIAGIYW